MIKKQTKMLKYEKRELPRLQQNENIAIINADKTHQMIILNKEDNSKKVLEVLKDIPREIVKRLHRKN